MAGYNLISKRLQALYDVPKKNESIHLNHVRKEFRLDLQRFISGETLGLLNGKPVIGRKLYQNWLTKLRKEGFDYDIRFK